MILIEWSLESFFVAITILENKTSQGKGSK